MEMNMDSTLKKEFEFYLKNQDELVKKYAGRYIVIKNDTVEGDYKTATEALEESKKKFEEGTFLIQLCLPGKDAYTQTYHSRVTFQ
jgi:Family of unknown function (DUF5678)